ncbi:hypothetical protein G9C85_16865 [Halorubellus sp. JP-L1]|uniref:DUF7521 family protein n=1 Tax=Halorubellus sp. JP-L1 TaxID=2715753 RepID=UPI0014093AA7|nr:hypothetical protein [Halorubellus sp. JP-L1]NHN43291.1 hypothetical protein [Halorubellus sp. JP-L1]
MSSHTPALVVALKAITLALGGLISYLSYRAYRRTGAGPLWYLAVGFGVITLGSLVAGVFDQFLTNVGRGTALVIESGLTAVGFAIITYSLYTE